MSVSLASRFVENLIMWKHDCERAAAEAITQAATETATEREKRKPQKRLGKPIVMEAARNKSQDLPSWHSCHSVCLTSDIIPPIVAKFALVFFINYTRTNKDILFLVDAFSHMMVLQRLSHVESARLTHVEAVNSQKIEAILLGFLDAAIDRPKPMAVPDSAMPQYDIRRRMVAL